MDKPNLDKLDNEIIRLLTENGRMPIGEMAKKLNVTSPTIRNRLKTWRKVEYSKFQDRSIQADIEK